MSEPPAIEINATFDTLQELKHRIKLYAIRNNFESRTIKSESRRYQLCCKAQGCPWLLHARPIEKSALWRITDLKSTHNCVGVLHAGNSSASAHFLATEMLEKVRIQPDIKPKNMKKDIHSRYGFKFPTHT